MGGLELLEEDLEVGVLEEGVVEDPQPHRQPSLLLGEAQGVAVGREVGHELEGQLAVLRALGTHVLLPPMAVPPPSTAGMRVVP